MWLSILFGVLIGAISYISVIGIIQLIKRKKALKKKDNNSIEE